MLTESSIWLDFIWRHLLHLEASPKFHIKQSTSLAVPAAQTPEDTGSCSKGVCLHTYNISPCVLHPAPPVPVRKKPEVRHICFHGTTPQLQKENQERALTLYLSSCPVEKPLTKYFHLLNPSGILPKALVSVDPGDFWQLLLAFAGFQPENKKW